MQSLIIAIMEGHLFLQWFEVLKTIVLSVLKDEGISANVSRVPKI